MPSPTPAQIEANRRNSQSSTGPATPAGKARAALNARKHGLSSTQLVIDNEEERQLFDEMAAALRAAMQPHGELEENLFDQALYAQWNLRRCRLAEAGLLSGGSDSEPNEAKARVVDRYLRRHEASYRRALKDLRDLQTARAFDALLAATPVSPNEPAAGEDGMEEQEEPEGLTGQAAPVPVADLVKARRAFLAEHSAKSRINARNLDNALDQLLRGPATAHITLFQFDAEPAAAA